MKKTNLFTLLFFCAFTYMSAQEITFFTPNTVRVVKNAPDTSKETNLSFVVTAKPELVKIKIKTVGDITTYSSSVLTVAVNNSSRQVTFFDSKGNKLMSEASMKFTPITQGPDKGRFKIQQSFALDKDEPIYGIGMLQNEKMNQRGEHRLMMQSNLEDYSNFFQSIKGYGIYWDNYSPTRIDDDDDELSLESQVGCKIDYYFMFGGNADGVIKEMRKLSGKVPMLPLWTYGFHQSRERYKSSQELLEVVDTYVKNEVPFDGIIQDWQYWGNNYLWNAMEFLSEDFSNYKRMIDHIHNLSKHISISIWASFGPETKAFRELSEKGLLYSFETWPQSGLSAWPPNMDYPSHVVCYDVYSKEARDIYWKNLSRLHNAGIDAWWMDSTDPDHHSFKDSDLDEERPITDPNTGKDIMGTWRSVRNAFPLKSVEGVYENQRAIDSTKRVFILTRSYFAGQQRTGANTWSGDVSSSWDSFRKQVPLCLNYTLTANPNVNSDIGGFFANAYNKGYADNTATKNPLYQELYVRWMQFGLFCPMMRSHGTEVFREIYHFGEPGEPIYDALLSTIKMRYEIMPYIYSLSWQVSKNDDSFMRALVMDFKDDKKVWDNNHEYMFGHSFLVAPVVNALYTPETTNITNEISGWNRNNKSLYQEGFTANWDNVKTYDVYLPQGAKWYDYWTNKQYIGGQTIHAEAPISHSPLFVRAGSIIPLCKADVRNANVLDWNNLDIMIYPGANAEFTLYEDEGDNYNYEKGHYSTITFKWNDKLRMLTIGKRLGSFKGMHTSRKFMIRVANANFFPVKYDGNAKSIKL